MDSLKERFEKEIAPEIQKELGIKNKLEVPRLKKVVINIGLSDIVSNPQVMQKVMEDLALITGQKPLITKAKKAISNFNIRKGQEIGLKVTLRRDRMWSFIDKLISIALPRIKDFRGVSRNAFDGFGNYSLGIRDHSVFPEIDPNKIDKIRSFEVIIVTSAGDDKRGYVLLKKLGMPFAKEEEVRMMEKMKESAKKEKKELAKMKAERQAEGKKAEETIE